MSYTYQTGILIGSLVAARLMGFDQLQARNVLGVAYSQCAGNQQALLEGVLTVRIQQGLSAMAAVLSARLASIGITGARQSLEGPAGYFAAFHGNRYRRDLILRDLGEIFEGDLTSIKPYPGCKFTHTSISAALELRRKEGFSVDAVERIVARISNREYFDIVCRPEASAERRQQLSGPDGSVRAQFSLPYLLAVALIHGEVALVHFDEQSRRNDAVLGLMDKVETVMSGPAEGTFERLLPSPGIVEIYLKGRTEPLSTRVDFPKGHPNNPMSYDEIADKFMTMSAAVSDRFGVEDRRSLIADIATAENHEDVSSLFAILH
jgi:2-methylcitrate dehydratase PrpD